MTIYVIHLLIHVSLWPDKHIKIHPLRYRHTNAQVQMHTMVKATCIGYSVGHLIELTQKQKSGLMKKKKKKKIRLNFLTAELKARKSNRKEDLEYQINNLHVRVFLCLVLTQSFPWVVSKSSYWRESQYCNIYTAAAIVFKVAVPSC